jgi:hypothetical protein
VAVLYLCPNQGYRVSVTDEIHTQSIEGFWSIHKVGAKYLPLYMAEFQFRYNQRETPDMFGMAIARC